MSHEQNSYESEGYHVSRERGGFGGVNIRHIKQLHRLLSHTSFSTHVHEERKNYFSLNKAKTYSKQCRSITLIGKDKVEQYEESILHFRIMYLTNINVKAYLQIISSQKPIKYSKTSFDIIQGVAILVKGTNKPVLCCHATNHSVCDIFFPPNGSFQIFHPRIDIWVYIASKVLFYY